MVWKAVQNKKAYLATILNAIWDYGDNRAYFDEFCQLFLDLEAKDEAEEKKWDNTSVPYEWYIKVGQNMGTQISKRTNGEVKRFIHCHRKGCYQDPFEMEDMFLPSVLPMKTGKQRQDVPPPI